MAKRKFGGITWRQPVVFAVSTAICTVLAIWAVITAPVGSDGVAVPGVSGLYISAAVYVPLALWFGVWGCLAGYLSCVFLGVYLMALGAPGYTLGFVLVWSLADFFEGFVPLLIYRSLKTRPVLDFKKPKVTYGINLLLAVVLAASAFALVYSYTWAFIASFGAALFLVLLQGFVEDRRTWLTWLPIGVFVAALTSGIFGVGALAAFGNIPLEAFGTVLFGWVFGDIIVLATLGTLLTVAFTPYIVRSKIYVKRYFS
ncbi:MAG: hypothetical protein NWE93_11380 [Candidatus Bathyarchaeota archaeon]|nr:hypothetical protein [Candidatus Bathyarchaeota archaeon]